MTATLLWYAAGQHTAALALVGVLAVFASLESAFGLCVGCPAFYLGMRLGLVPPQVCEDCARVLAAERRLRRVSCRSKRCRTSPRGATARRRRDRRARSPSARARCSTSTSDADHNRSVFTLVGEEGELVEALLAGIACARERIDLREHEGAHPRIGAADVVPLVPVRPEDMERARAAALELARRVGEELGLPVFLYGELAPGRGPAFFRRGGPAELQRRIDAGELAPDFGPARLDPSAGGVLVGARPAADRVQRRPRRRRRRGGAGDRAASCASAAAASPACARSGSRCRAPGTSR